MKARIIAIPTTGRQLQAGDLFSTVGPDYWTRSMDAGSIGERVYIRTNSSLERSEDADGAIYKIEIVRES